MPCFLRVYGKPECNVGENLLRQTPPSLLCGFFGSDTWYVLLNSNEKFAGWLEHFVKFNLFVFVFSLFSYSHVCTHAKHLSKDQCPSLSNLYPFLARSRS